VERDDGLFLDIIPDQQVVMGTGEGLASVIRIHQPTILPDAKPYNE
jgi:hypothetical protein